MYLFLLRSKFLTMPAKHDHNSGLSSRSRTSRSRDGLEAFFRTSRSRLDTVTPKSQSRLGLGIIRLVYIELQTSKFKLRPITKNLYSIEILGRLSISAENRDFCLFLNSSTLAF